MDRISMPNRDLFMDESHFYATVLHEIAHSTGHESRLDREEGMKSRFGTQEYAKEELRAEMASVFIHSDIGIQVTEEGMKKHTEQHAAYVQNWMKILKEDYKELFRATRDANKIADYVLAYEKERVQAQECEAPAEEQTPDTPPFEPQIGQRVIFQPHEGTARLIGTVREGLYAHLLLSEKLMEHLADVEEEASGKLELLMARMLEKDPPPDRATDQTGWVRHMNMTKALAESIVIREIVFE
jgi:hypothetical protein